MCARRGRPILSLPLDVLAEHEGEERS